MAFQEIGDVKLVTLGGRNTKTGNLNPTVLEGYLVKSEERPNKYNPEKPKTLYVFRTAEGLIGTVAPSNLERKLSGATVGAMTKIAYTGDKDVGKGNPMKEFKVFQDKTNTIDTGTDSYEDIGESEVEEESYHAPLDTKAKVKAGLAKFNK